MPKKKLLQIPWTEKTGLSLKWKLRTVKMVACVCSRDCPKSGPGWWDTCSHDPYHSMREVESGGYVQNADGTFSPAEDGKGTFIRIPNVRQVAFTQRVRSKLGVQAQLARGWKHPQDVDPGDGTHEGYAPMCEFNNCYAPNPTVKTSAGSYCTPIHAKAVLLKERGETEEVYDKAKQRQQLEAIPLA